jgi:hypothetical protein
MGKCVGGPISLDARIWCACSKAPSAQLSTGRNCHPRLTAKAKACLSGLFGMAGALLTNDTMSASYSAIFPSLQTAKLAFPPPPAFPPAATGGAAAPAEEDSFGRDVFETLNPLQHIPIVSMIYRQITGDKIGPVERIAGDTLYGGLLGLASSVANVAFQEVTGKDFGDTAFAMMGLSGGKPTAVAAGGPATQPAPPRVATAAPAQLIPVAATTASSSIRSGTAGAFDDRTTKALMGSLDGKGTGLDLGAGTAPTASTMATSPLPAAATQTTDLDDQNASALMASLNRGGVATDMSLRAMYAYRKTIGLPTGAPSSDATLH